ncbi:MAG: DHHW family protein [Anaerorhabdus sp.]
MKKIEKFSVLLFCLFISFFMVFLFIKDEKEFSDNENRFLALKPEFSTEALFQGEYTTELDEFITDQFPLRDFWVKLKSTLEYVSFKLENNGVYYGKDNFLIPQFINFDENIMKSNIKKMKDLQEFYQDIDFSYMIIPTKSEIADDKLKFGSVGINQSKLIENLVKDIDGVVNLDDLNRADYYYKTDHHWNKDGSYIAYSALMNKLNEKVVEFNYDLKKDDFKGTSYSSAQAYWYQSDEIYQILPKNKIDSLVLYDKEIVKDSIYEDSWLDKKDKYAYYLDGNHAFVEIESENVINDRGTLLIIKDSFAHQLVPYLTSHYSKIIMVDLRYYNQPVSEVISNSEIDRVLYVYSLDTLNEEKNFVFLK